VHPAVAAREDGFRELVHARPGRYVLGPVDRVGARLLAPPAIYRM
jgi:hypothetical protein